MSALRSITVLILALAAPAYGAEEFLDPEQAFQFSARLIDGRDLEVRYRIAEGYYMYRDRYRFSARPESVELGDPNFPEGQWHDDEFFGRSEVYRNEVVIRIPVTHSVSGESIELVVVSQGCADAGICYLPKTDTTEFWANGLSGFPGDTR